MIWTSIRSKTKFEFLIPQTVLYLGPERRKNPDTSEQAVRGDLLNRL